MFNSIHIFKAEILVQYTLYTLGQLNDMFWHQSIQFFAVFLAMKTVEIKPKIKLIVEKD